MVGTHCMLNLQVQKIHAEKYGKAKHGEKIGVNMRKMRKIAEKLQISRINLHAVGQKNKNSLRKACPPPFATRSAGVSKGLGVGAKAGTLMVWLAPGKDDDDACRRGGGRRWPKLTEPIQTHPQR